MTNNETLKKYGLPLFFYVGDTFVNTCGSLVEIVEVEKENLKICGPSGTFDYKPLDILKRLVKKDYTSYKQAPIKSLITQTKTFNLPVNEKESKKLCHYIGATYSDDLKCISIFNGEVIVKGFTRKRIQNCSIEYIKAVLAELPDVNTPNNKSPVYVSTLTPNKQKKFNNWVGNLKEATKKQRLEIKRTYLLSKLSNPSIIEFYNLLEGKNCGNKANILLNKWSIKWKEEEKNSKEFTEGLGKYATTMNPCGENAYSLLKFKEKRDIKKLDENLLLLL